MGGDENMAGAAVNFFMLQWRLLTLSMSWSFGFRNLKGSTPGWSCGIGISIGIGIGISIGGE
jgi:hypothetical protein